MKIAVPVTSGRLSGHFGHSPDFALVETDEATGRVLSSRTLTPPPHEPGSIPRWIAQQGVGLVIAGGIGEKARAMLADRGVAVVAGAPEDTAEHLALAYLAGTLQTGRNNCDH